MNLGEGLEEIGFHIIVGCTPLQRIVIPFTVKEIRDGAFCHCQQATTVQLNERLEDTSLQRIVNHGAVTRIDDKVFNG